MLSAAYYLKQAELAARLALAESDPEKLRALHILALEHYDRADKARGTRGRDQRKQQRPDGLTPPQFGGFFHFIDVIRCCLSTT